MIFAPDSNTKSVPLYKCGATPGISTLHSDDADRTYIQSNTRGAHRMETPHLQLLFIYDLGPDCAMISLGRYVGRISQLERAMEISSVDQLHVSAAYVFRASVSKLIKACRVMDTPLEGYVMLITDGGES